MTFDDDRAVADAGLILTGTLLQKLELEAVTDATVEVGYRPSRKLAALVHTLVAGGDCIDGVARGFTFGHVPQPGRSRRLRPRRRHQARPRTRLRPTPTTRRPSSLIIRQERWIEAEP